VESLAGVSLTAGLTAIIHAISAFILGAWSKGAAVEPGTGASSQCPAQGEMSFKVSGEPPPGVPAATGADIPAQPARALQAALPASQCISHGKAGSDPPDEHAPEILGHGTSNPTTPRSQQQHAF